MHLFELDGLSDIPALVVDLGEGERLLIVVEVLAVVDFAYLAGLEAAERLYNHGAMLGAYLAVLVAL